jgi:hypothetical protein
MGKVYEQKDGDTQVVIFTIKGDISQADRDYWNQAVANLQAKFPQLVGVTLVGRSTPPGAPSAGPLPAP